jgi:hypothetical protein
MNRATLCHRQSGARNLTLGNAVSSGAGMAPWCRQCAAVIPTPVTNPCGTGQPSSHVHRMCASGCASGSQPSATLGVCHLQAFVGMPLCGGHGSGCCFGQPSREPWTRGHLIAYCTFAFRSSMARLLPTASVDTCLTAYQSSATAYSIYCSSGPAVVRW